MTIKWLLQGMYSINKAQIIQIKIGLIWVCLCHTFGKVLNFSPSFTFFPAPLVLDTLNSGFFDLAASFFLRSLSSFHLANLCMRSWAVSGSNIQFKEYQHTPLYLHRRTSTDHTPTIMLRRNGSAVTVWWRCDIPSLLSFLSRDNGSVRGYLRPVWVHCQ